MSGGTMTTLAATVRVGDTLFAEGHWVDVIGTRFSWPVEGKVTFSVRPAGDQRAESRDLPPCPATAKVTLLRT